MYFLIFSQFFVYILCFNYFLSPNFKTSFCFNSFTLYLRFYCHKIALFMLTNLTDFLELNLTKFLEYLFYAKHILINNEVDFFWILHMFSPFWSMLHDWSFKLKHMDSLTLPKFHGLFFFLSLFFFFFNVQSFLLLCSV